MAAESLEVDEWIVLGKKLRANIAWMDYTNTDTTKRYTYLFYLDSSTTVYISPNAFKF